MQSITLFSSFFQILSAIILCVIELYFFQTNSMYGPFSIIEKSSSNNNIIVTLHQKTVNVHSSQTPYIVLSSRSRAKTQWGGAQSRS